MSPASATAHAHMMHARAAGAFFSLAFYVKTTFFSSILRQIPLSSAMACAIDRAAVLTNIAVTP